MSKIRTLNFWSISNNYVELSIGEILKEKETLTKCNEVVYIIDDIASYIGS